MKKVLIFNAPPNAGKDISADYVCQRIDGRHCEMKMPLHLMTARLLDMSIKEYLELYEDHKDAPNLMKLSQLMNYWDNPTSYSVREFYIHLSENVMKPTFGRDVFGHYAGKNLVHGWNVFSDGGFNEEVKALQEYTDKKNIIVVKIQRDGCNFENDSRGWIDDTLVGETIYMENNNGLDTWERKLDELIGRIA